MRVFLFGFITLLFMIAGCGGENQPPSTPNRPYPANGDTGVPIDVEFSWRCKDPDGDHVSYSIYVQDEREEDYYAIEDQLKPVLQIKGLKYDTNYRWRVVAHDENGHVTEGPTWTFTTQKYSPPTQEEKVIANETVKVEPGKYVFWRFSMVRDARIHGEVSSNAAINVWLMTKRDFEAFEKWQEFSSYAEASRKQVLQFTFDHTAPENSDYYFVLDNRASLFSSKTVSIFLKTVE